jgi:laccase
MLRAIVHGAIVIKPRNGSQGRDTISRNPTRSGSFYLIYSETSRQQRSVGTNCSWHFDTEIIILHAGEWWYGNAFDLQRKVFLTGNLVPPANACTINGKLGDLHSVRAVITTGPV